MGSSNIKMERQIKVLKEFKKYEDELFSYFTQTNSLLDNLQFYIVPKNYILEFYETFRYNKNIKELEQLNIYYDTPDKTVENKEITKGIIYGLKNNNYYIFKYDINLRKIINEVLIDKVTNDNKYIFKIDKDGLFIPLTFGIWEKFQRYYKCDITLKREGFVNKNGEIIIRIEDSRIDSFFIHNRTGDVIYHFCFIEDNSWILYKLYNYFKLNSIKEFLDILNIKHVGEEIGNSKFMKIEKIIPADIEEIGNNKINIIFLDNYNFHDVDDSKYYYIKDLKKSIFGDINENSMNNNNIIMNNNKIIMNNDNMISGNIMNNNERNNINDVANSRRKSYNDFYLLKSAKLLNQYRNSFENINNSKYPKYPSNKTLDYNIGNIELRNPEKIELNKKESINQNNQTSDEKMDISVSFAYKSTKDSQNVQNSNIKDSNFLSSQYDSKVNITESIVISFPNYSSYIDSILQCLLNIKKVLRYFKDLQINNTNKKNLLNLIFSFYKGIISKKNNLEDYLKKIYLYIENNKIGNSSPKDILFTILNDLHNSSIRQGRKQNIKGGGINIDEKEALNDFKDNRYTISDFFKIYGGIFKKEYYCVKCRTKYYKFKTFFMISIDVDYKNNIYNDNLNFMQYLYKNGFNKEVMSKKYSCDKCNRSKFFTNKIIFACCPEILILFFNNKNINERKYFYINYSLQLNVSNIENVDSEYNYELNSFIEYDIKNDEFISYTRNNGVWKRMKKESTEIINSIEKINNPQILFYEKIKKK